MLLNKRDIFLSILVLMLFLNVFPINVTEGQADAQVSVAPLDQTVGQPSLPLPTPAFSINITVDNVVDLYAWQVVLYYNSTILNFDSAVLPPGHVFDGKDSTQLGPTLGADTKGQYLFFGAMLQGSALGFNGPGKLCQIKFVGQAKGTSSLRLDVITDPPPGGPVGFYTTLLDSYLNEMSISIVNGQVAVVSEVQKPPSSITIGVDHDSGPLGSNVTISGDINVTRSGLVTISYRANGSVAWSELTRVATDAIGHYVYSWNTTNAGIKVYELKASWLGDVDYEGAESSIVTVSVSKKTSSISLSAQPANVTAGSSVTLKGGITPRPLGPTYPTVKISFRLVGGLVWTVLQDSLQINQEGNYTFTWTTSTRGSYELQVSWEGDPNYVGAESSISAVEVTGEAPPGGQPDFMAYLPYIVAAVAIVAVAGVALYFLKFRKR
jgi:hypothetical protein